jgi:1-deoxy-D-xylulose-5-phosphate synthase
MGLLEAIATPRDLRDLTDEQLDHLAAEIRDFLVTKIARTGGHLGPNLGVVELTMAIHRVFDSPTDRVLFDTGHQAYVHKVLTGRAADFDRLRQQDGLSGYPSRSESTHDVIENSHASTALSYADGLAKAYALRGEKRHVVALVGDGALTGGMAWEALNNIAADKTRPLVIVVNDNGRSYTPTVGGLAQHLASLRTDPRYERVLELVRSGLGRTPLVGSPLYDVLHGIKRGLKDVLAPQGLFEDLGLKYIGPIDGHDRVAVEQALELAKGFGGPVIVHAITRKGFGYSFAERDEADNLHSPSAFDPEVGPVLTSAGNTWTHAFADELVAIGQERPDVVAITAAMLHPTGLDRFAAHFPDRVFDVGIAEQHAVTSAAGLAMGGMHPVVAIYATFLNRAFDQVLMDVGLHGCGVTFVLDRAGITGEDGPSHNGMWDLSILQVVPGLRIAAPRDGARVRELLREAVQIGDAPTVLRFPGKSTIPDIEAVGRVGDADVLVRSGARDVLLMAVGAMAAVCVDVAQRLTAQGIGVTLVDPRWVKPVGEALVDLAADHRLVVTVEDNVRTGGCGAALTQALRDSGAETPVRVFGIPARFLPHAKRDALLAQVGLTAQDLAREVVETVTGLAGSDLVAGGEVLADADAIVRDAARAGRREDADPAGEDANRVGEE